MNDSQREKIRTALEQLDHDDNTHWTDDGLPRTGVVQKLANDTTIKRSDINEAVPGFARKVGDAMGDPPEGVTEAGAAEDKIKTGSKDGDGELMTEAEVHAILTQNIVVAEAAVKAAQRKIMEGHADEKKAVAALAAARQDHQAKFPPMTPMENIKQYLASENAKRAAEAGKPGHYEPARVDAAAQRHNSRGWRRPIRPAMGVDGKLVMPQQREQRSFPSQGVGAVPQR